MLLHTLTASRARISALAGLPVGLGIQCDDRYFVQVRDKGQAEPCAAHRTRAAYNAVRARRAARPVRSLHMLTGFAGPGDRAQAALITAGA